MVQFIADMEHSIDPLTEYLELAFQFGPHLYVPLDVFKRSYMEFRKGNGHAVVAWNQDH